MTLIDVGEVQLDYERSGAGPPLLMIVGMSGSALTWGEPFLELLRADFEVIVYDHQGVGASSRLEGPITTREMAAHAAGLLAALELDSAHVLGISMGGMIAQELALASPERIRTLTLGCTYCGGPNSVRSGEDPWRRIAEARAAGDRQLALRASWENNVSATFAADRREFRRFAERALRRPVAVAVIERQGRAVIAHDTCERLGRIELPTLVIHGSEDRLLPLANGRMIAELIPGARLEVFDGVGHLFFLERPERSAALLREHAAVHA
ncbi:MAG TPA: alpha/beta fold hydrolase [Solirubrobacteraceae bacterium]|nr:alpha/beta fold hydrolase [Solirubrobacteraceae bacterium]